MNTNTTTILARLVARERQRIADQIRARREALAAQQQRTTQIVAQLEADLAYGRQQLAAIAGGLQELDGQLELLDSAGA